MLRGFSLPDESSLAQAEAEFSQVIDEYETGNDNVRALAAEAYAGLGLLSHAQENYAPAIEAYEKAIELTDDPAKAARLYAALGLIYESLGNLERAVGAYESAFEAADNPVERESYRQRLEELRELQSG